MPQEDDLFTALQPGSFDGIIIPVQTVRIHTGSAAAFHKFPYRPGQKIEYTGREPVSGSITAAFFNGIEEGARVALWPDGLQLLRRRIQEQRSGKLVIPPLGELPKAKLDMEESYSFEAREGAFVTLNFAEDSLEQFTALSVPSARGRLPDLAVAADNALAILRIRLQDLGLDDDGVSIASLSQFVDNLLGNLERIQDDIAKPIARAATLVTRIDDLINATSALGSAENWPLRDALLDLKDATVQAVEDAGVAAGRAVRTFTVAAPMTIAHVASATGNTVEELLQLNALPDPNDLQTGDDLFVYAP